MPLQRDRRLRDADPDVTAEVEIVPPARVGRRARGIGGAAIVDLAERGLGRRIGRADGDRCRADRARGAREQFDDVAFGKAARIGVPGDAAVQRRAAEIMLVSADRVEFEIGAAERAPTGQVRRERPDVEAAFVRDRQRCLQGGMLVGLRHAAQAIIADDGRRTADGDRRGRIGFALREGGSGGSEHDAAKEESGEAHRFPFVSEGRCPRLHAKVIASPGHRPVRDLRFDPVAMPAVAASHKTIIAPGRADCD